MSLGSIGGGNVSWTFNPLYDDNAGKSTPPPISDPLTPADTESTVKSEKSDQKLASNVKNARTAISVASQGLIGTGLVIGHYLHMNVGTAIRSCTMDSGLFACVTFPTVVHSSLAGYKESRVQRLSQASYEKMAVSVAQLHTMVEGGSVSPNNITHLQKTIDDLGQSQRLKLSPTITSRFSNLQTQWQACVKGGKVDTSQLAHVAGALKDLQESCQSQAKVCGDRSKVLLQKSVAYAFTAFATGALGALQGARSILVLNGGTICSGLTTAITVFADISGAMAIGKGLHTLITYGKEALEHRTNLIHAKQDLAVLKEKYASATTPQARATLQQNIETRETEIKALYTKYQSCSMNAVKGLMGLTMGITMITAHIIAPGSGLILNLSLAALNLGIATGLTLLQKRAQVRDTQKMDFSKITIPEANSTIQPDNPAPQLEGVATTPGKATTPQVILDSSLGRRASFNPTHQQITPTNLGL